MNKSKAKKRIDDYFNNITPEELQEKLEFYCLDRDIQIAEETGDPIEVCEKQCEKCRVENYIEKKVEEALIKELEYIIRILDDAKVIGGRNFIVSRYNKLLD